MNVMTRQPLNVGITALTAASAAWMGLLANQPPAEAKQHLIDSPSSGVICDRSTRSCYDRDGISLSLTRKYFGSKAERQLWYELIGRPRSLNFTLSNGSSCDLRAQSCWSDGSRRRRLDRTLSLQLFGQVNSKGRAISTSPGRCTLARGASLMHKGGYSLKLVERRNGVSRYVVNLPNDRKFSFSDRSGRLNVTDATGSWTVNYIDHGTTGVFRWRDMTLVATQGSGDFDRGRGASDGISALFNNR